MLKRLIFVALALLSLAAPALAQPRPSAELSAGAGRVVALFKGEAAPADIFTPAFLAEVPEAQVRAISRQLAGQYGAVRGLAGIEPASPQAGTIHIAFERATLHMSLAVDPRPPHRVSGLQLTGADMAGDSFEAVTAEIRALPGQTGFAVARLGGAAPVLAASVEPDRPLAIGSTFKLFILAELSRQARAGERRWGDVVPLDRRSMPGGTLSAWPAGSPVTLHTLASLMISISDNTATDMLLHTVGRGNVERMLATIGVRDPRNRPLLSTLELAAIKTGPAAALNAWLQADEAGRRRMLAGEYANPDPARIDVVRFAGNPMAIDGVEWFASANELVLAMDWLRINADDTSRAIMAISPGLPARSRGEFAYVGYKGGSEPGVLSLTWLIRTRAGAWHAVTGSWNNPAAPVEEARFAGLMQRAVLLLR